MSNPGTANLVSYWALTESSGTRADSAANGNDLTANNSPGGSVNGVDLNGTNQTLSIADASQTGLDMSQSFTLVCFATPDTLSGDRCLFNKANFGTGTDLSYLLYMRASGKLQFYCPDASGNVTNPDTTNVVMTANTEKHIAAVFDHTTPTTPVIYIDGSSVSLTNNSTANTGSTRNSAQDFTIGAYEVNNAYTAYFNGEIKQAMVFNKALSSAEVTWLYNSGAGRSYADISAGAAGGFAFSQAVIIA